ncbi:MAG TPA: hypothetical protein VF432_29455 [Thermoanaerobaculia bacterium]
MSSIASPRWIVSPGFDLVCFFGGAALSALFLGLYFLLGVSIVALWWVWLLAFDGPHIGAAFTRTYLDAQEWRQRRGLLLVSLLTFAAGPLALIANEVTGSQEPFLLFLGLATFYGYYHVVRQHWGFVALYNTVNRDYGSMRLDRATLYIGCFAPYAYFLLTHPKARVLLHLPARTSTAETALAWLLVAVWGAVLLRFASVQLRARGLRNPKTPYLLITVLLYGAIYFAVARYEPVYGASTGPDEDFLLLSIAIVIFHNVQYLGLVWFHNRNRYAEARDHGAAHTVNRNLYAYLAVCVLFSAAVYFTFACSTGVFPLCRWSASARWNQVGLCLWWGLAMNHYYLDQKIWRIRGDDALKRALRLA